MPKLKPAEVESHEYLDLAFAMKDHRPGCFFLGFPDWAPWPLLDGVYRIEIRVSAINSLPLTAVYRIEKAGAMELSMQQIH